VGFWVAVFPSWQIKKLATGFCRFCPKAKATQIRVVGLLGGRFRQAVL